METAVGEKIKSFLFSKRYEIYLIIIIVFGYFPVSFFLHPLKFGAVYFHLPWRYAIVENLRSGNLPLWFFNHHLGVPIHADPQSGAWYPFVWLFALFGKYGFYSLHSEFMLHIIIAALGMFYFGKALQITAFSSFIMAVAYVFSGIFADNVLMSWTVSLAWLPVIGAAAVLFFQRQNTADILALSLSMSMLILGGYPPFALVAAYLLLFAFLLFSVKYFKNGSFKKYLISNILVFATTVVITSVLLVSVYLSLNQMFRSAPVSLQYSLTGALHPYSFVSLLFPFASVATGQDIIPQLHTYFTMANSYFGIIPLMLFAAAPFVLKKNKLYLYFLAAGILLLLYSLGAHTFVFALFYKILPGFDFFRYSNFTRAFFIMAFLIVAAMSLDKITEEKKYSVLLTITVVFLIIYLLVLAVVLINGNIRFAYSGLYDFLKNINFEERILLQGLFFFVLLLFFYFMLKNKNINKKRVLAFFIIADMLISFQINFVYSGYATGLSLREADIKIEQSAHPIDLKRNTNVLKNIVKNGPYLFDFGMNEYSGRVSPAGNGSFKTSDFSKLIDKHPQLVSSLLSKPLLFYTKNIGAVDSLVSGKGNVGENAVYLSADDYRQYRDSSVSGEAGRILSAKFLPQTVILKTCGSGFLTLLQNYYPGWTVSVDGKRKPIIKSGFSFMSVYTGEGAHNVVFKYQNPLVKYAFYLSALSFSIVFFLYLWLIRIKSKRH